MMSFDLDSKTVPVKGYEPRKYYKIYQIILINCNHLHCAMGYFLGYRSDNRRGTWVRIPLGAENVFSKENR